MQENLNQKEEENQINPLQEERSDKSDSFLSIFIPRKDYMITPILIILNVIIFLIMIGSGVHFMEPDSESLLAWGANFRPVTLNGEWWRLFTSCFLHIGVVHLLMNMYALVYIGILLEPMMGKSRFLVAYILSGITASAASLYWNDFTVSAGASGAIFGMYGVFLAMLTTNLIDKETKKTFFVSIAVFVGYNLLNGFRGGIDNAAHIGGLITGALIGYAFYPSLIKKASAKLKFGLIGLVSVVFLTISLVVLLTTEEGDMGRYEAAMIEFGELEEKGLRIYNLPENTSDQHYLTELEFTGIPAWEKNIRLLENLDTLDLEEELVERNQKLKEYSQLRLKTFKLIQSAIKYNTNEYQPEIDSFNLRIEMLVDELNPDGN